MIRVAVLLGGISNEREISLKSGKQVAKFLNKTSYKVSVYDPKTQFIRFVKDLKEKKIDVVFNALHGKGGEDGSIQGVLDWMNIPYTGSGVAASALAMDKARAKAIYRENGIPTPASLVVDAVDMKQIKAKLGSQIVIKPNADGSSVGVFVKPTQSRWKKLIEERIDAEGACLIEAFREGREFTVGVLGSEALPVVEIRPKNAFFDFEAKYTPGMSNDICPAPIPPRITRRAQELAIKAHDALGCRGYSRTDMILTKR